MSVGRIRSRRAARWGRLAILVGALGIAFGFVGAVLAIGHASWNHLPAGVADADYITIGRRVAANGAFETLAVADFEAIRRAIPGHWALADRVVSEKTLHTPDLTTVRVRDVSTSFFAVLGVQPALGSLVAESGGGVVISHRLWQRQYGGEPVLGQQFNLTGELPRTIVGVAAREFADVFFEEADAWTLNTGREYVPAAGSGYLEPLDKLMFGTLGTGATIETVARFAERFRFAEKVHVGYELTISTTAHELDRLQAAEGLALFPHRRQETGHRLGWLAAVVSVLFALTLLALVDFLAAAQEGRHQEQIARRAAGATPRHLLFEAIAANAQWLLPIAALAWLTCEYVASALLLIEPFATFPGDLPLSSRLVGVSLGWLLLVAAFCASTAWTSRVAANSSRMTSAPAWPNGHRVARLALMTTAMASLLLSGSLMVHYFVDARYQLGFDPARLHVVLPVKAQGFMMSDREMEALKAAAQAMPEVQQAIRAEMVPLVSAQVLPTTRIDLRAPASGRDLAGVDFFRNAVDGGYFETVGASFITGRPLRADTNEAVVSQTAASSLAESPEEVLGLPVMLKTSERDQNGAFKAVEGVFTIVGIVQDIPYGEYDAPSRAIVYQGLEHRSIYDFLVVRTSDPHAVIEVLRQSFAVADHVELVLAAQFRQQFVARRSIEAVIAAGALFAFVLAFAGIATAVGRTLASERQAIGIRLAVGATPIDLMARFWSGMAVELTFATAFVCVLAVAARGLAPTVATMVEVWLLLPVLLFLVAGCAFLVSRLVRGIITRSSVTNLIEGA